MDKEWAVPAESELHVISDDSATHKTPAIQRWVLVDLASLAFTCISRSPTAPV
jgi:hypothetical protein